MDEAEVEDWVANAAPAFRSRGAAVGWDVQCARLFAAFHIEGLNPRVARIWSTDEHQMQLQRQYDALIAAGQDPHKHGFNARPADHSNHTAKDFHGNPAATAIDIDTDDPKRAGQIAEELGIGNGLKFKKPDPSHYFQIKS